MARIEVKSLGRDRFEKWRDELAALRIAVFAEYPYLYDGDLDYERHYLNTYMQSANAFLAGAFEGETLVGACTAAPLLEHHDAFGAPLAEMGIKPQTVFYFGESVLLPQYRGQGVGVRFFQLREQAARDQDFSICLFTSVIRPDHHPAKPMGYAPLDEFWRKRGFERLPGVKTHFAWKDHGDLQETQKPMEYWIKHLRK